MSKIKIFSLGGLNEAGKNLYIIEVEQDLFVFDSGLKYSDDTMLGVDYIIPNYDYLIKNQDRIKGIFISHGHDEEMGALPDMLINLPKVKVYGTKFTLEIIKEELDDEHLSSTNLIEIKPNKKLIFGKNSVFPIQMTHSIPDAVGYVLYTPDGAIFYTSNYLFDATMNDAYKTDIGKLAYIGKQGVLCLLGESLYADKIDYTSPKHRMYDAFNETISKYEGRIICNVYSTQIYRMQELFKALSNNDRKVVIMGKRLESIITKAIDMGYMQFERSRIVDIHHASDPNVFVLISDERETPFANLNRIIRGFDKFITLNDNDTVMFVSPTYPGTEKTASRLLDRLAKKNVNIIEFSNKKYVDLHASKEDIMMMVDLMNPKYYMPIMGEYRLQVENANAAKAAGLKDDQIILRLNGQVAEFDDGQLVKTEELIPTDDILIDGKTPGDIGELVMKDRETLSINGLVMVTATLSKVSKKIIAGPEIITKGFMYDSEAVDLIKASQDIAVTAINNNTKNNYVDFNKIKQEIREKLGKYLYKETECSPMILVVVQEV